MPSISKRVYSLCTEKVADSLKTYRMEVTNEYNLMNPDSTIENQVKHNENNCGNKNEGIILNKTDSVKSDDDIALCPLHSSIEDTGQTLNSAG